MKLITETKKRYCCEPEDLVPLVAKILYKRVFKCVHCGDWWIEYSYTDAAGGRDTKLVRWYPISTF
jgi:hypothetical protein